MMIETLLAMGRYLSPRQDDDWSDRLHYLVTPNILLTFSVLISFKQFGGRPLECMFPNKFPGSWEQYAENLCWAQSTYFVDSHTYIEHMSTEERRASDRELSYYQWVPFFLIIQAAFFRLPSLFWRYFCNHSGIRVHEVVNRARDPQNIDQEVKERNIQTLTKHITNCLRFQRRLELRSFREKKSCTYFNVRYSASFMTFVYIVTKLLYLLNACAQIYFLNKFLVTKSNSRLYGLDVLQQLVNGTEWQNSGIFPRTSICDFEIRQMGGNMQTYSVQCVLVINLFNEKIFILLWFWFVVLVFTAIISTFYWLIVMAFPCFSRTFIAQHLELGSLEFHPLGKKSRKDVLRFVKNYLHRDGILVLRMVNSHAGVIFATDLVISLWRIFTGYEHVGEKKEKEDEQPNGGSRRSKKKSSLLPESDLDFSSSTDFSPLTPIAGNIQEDENEDEKPRAAVV